ncbi:hypothetical protein [Mesorhizobium sp. LNJC391B00]|uniref:hypothetical protein n=1 Tax=Mesorhizobium sp. LNJC391B00 TaxID=1287273 RepID=UPI0012EB24E1|nr:hypothetical protein [Mesorhizobium sp. LNJC391B00]
MTAENQPTPRRRKTRLELLCEINGLPDDAFIDTVHAAAFIQSSPSVLMNWRSQRRGPRYHGNGDFIRYTITDLKTFMSHRRHEVALAGTNHNA